MFTGFRLSLGHRLAGDRGRRDADRPPGVGGFLWQEYNSLIYEHIILCILTIGLVGFVLDRLMSRGGAPIHDRVTPRRSAATAVEESTDGVPELDGVCKGYGPPGNGPRCCATST